MFNIIKKKYLTSVVIIYNSNIVIWVKNTTQTERKNEQHDHNNNSQHFLIRIKIRIIRQQTEGKSTLVSTIEDRHNSFF
jgi:hypothetical protein